ncbi:undecaprenyl-phosphate glucose phosphotransferase [Methylocella sp.]|uniref:undecaprenyl-phosphate glucose phosphotransferase n=1 Tax=Methylocella sp. TaxID=1978226 RepID=UPI003784FE1F
MTEHMTVEPMSVEPMTAEPMTAERSAIRVRGAPARGGQRALSAPVFRGALAALDVAALVAAGGAASAALAAASGPPPAGGALALACLAGVVAGAATLSASGAHDLERLRAIASRGRAQGLATLLKSSLAAAVAAALCLFLSGAQGGFARAFPFAFGAAGALLLVASRLGLRGVFGRWLSEGRFRRRVAIFAVSDFSAEFIRRLQAEPDLFEIVGVYDDRLRSGRVPRVHAGVPVRGSLADLLRDSRDARVDVIAVALPLSAVDRIAAVLQGLSSAVADLCLTTDLAGVSYHGRQFAAVGANPVISVSETPIKDWRAVKKACLDYGFGSLALLLLAPLLALIAVAVKLDSPGPALFRQPRLGFNNRLFTCYKFRTMHTHMTDVLADRQTVRGDPRVTRIGKWLRRFSLDELPQLFNVLDGTMSLVGPRPHAPNTKAADRLFADVVKQYAVRHRVKPGVTGWAQVNGWRGETTTVEEIENRVRCDLYYIDNWSVAFDLRIMALTVLREVFSARAY